MPSRLTQVRTRLPRVVFAAEVAGREVYFKAELPNEERDYALALEAWALSVARDAGIPVPEVLHIDCTESAFPFRFLLMTRVEGVPLERSGLDPDREDVVLRQAGALIHLLHQTQVDGFDRLDDDAYLRTGEIRGTKTDWRAMTHEEALAAVEDLAEAAIFDEARARRCRASLAAGATLIPALERGSLLHGDFDRSHIFVDSAGALTGVIDFGDRESGDPAWEFAGFRLWEEQRLLDRVLEGYADAGGSLERDVIAVYRLIRMLRLLHRRLRSGRLQDIAILRPRLLSMLETRDPQA
jgi:aminoglycoside phosphotransferase (APT) family kinase protein